MSYRFTSIAAAGGAHKILEEALKKGYVDCHIWKVLVMGVAGSGKLPSSIAFLEKSLQAFAVAQH